MEQETIERFLDTSRKYLSCVRTEHEQEPDSRRETRRLSEGYLRLRVRLAKLYPQLVNACNNGSSHQRQTGF